MDQAKIMNNPRYEIKLVRSDDAKQYHGSVFSFGGGVQSTAIALLIKHEPERFIEAVGFFPEYWIFADTGAEKAQSLENVRKCSQELHKIIMVQNFKRNATNRLDDIPVFFKNHGYKQARQCTEMWKIAPINKAIRKLYPKKSPKRKVAVMLGISTDEAFNRMKTSRLRSLENVYPLIDLNLNREDCYRILEQYNWAAVKSACYMCPFQASWRHNPEIEKAIDYEQRMQETSKYRKTPYLHSSAKPLKEAYEFEGAQNELFNMQNECFGVCES